MKISTFLPLALATIFQICLGALCTTNSLAQTTGSVAWERFILTSTNYSYTKDIAKFDDSSALLATRFNDELHSAVIKVGVNKGEFLWTTNNFEEYPVLLEKVKRFSDGSINAIGSGFPEDNSVEKIYFLKLNVSGDKILSVCSTLETNALGLYSFYYFLKNKDQFAVLTSDIADNKKMKLIIFGSVGEVRKIIFFESKVKFTSGTITQNDKNEMIVSVQSDSIRNYVIDENENSKHTSTIPTQPLACYLSTHSSGSTYLFSQSPNNAFARYDVLGLDNQYKFGDNFAFTPENMTSYAGGFANMRYNILAGHNFSVTGSPREKKFLLSGFDEQMKNNFSYSWGKNLQNSKLVNAIQLNDKEFLVAGERGLSDDTTTRMIYVARVSINRNVSVEQNTNSLQASIYPNPASGDIFIKADNFQLASIFNSIGELILESTEPRIDLRQIAAGNYFVRINNNKKFIPLVVIK